MASRLRTVVESPLSHPKAPHTKFSGGSTMSKESAVIPFHFESKEVRILKDKSGNPWWVAKDVCDVLDIKNPTQAVQQLDDDERAIQNIGRQGEANIINESGLYTLIIRSNKPEAKKFRKWVTSEVLPAIRKTGSYSAASQTLSPAQQRDVQVAIAERVYASGTVKGDKIVSSSQFQALHRSVKNRFHVGSYKDIPASCFDDLMTYIATCPIEAAKAIECPKPIDEKALALRVADVIMKQVQPQVIRYEKTSDIGDLLVSKLAEVKSDILREVAGNMVTMKQAIVNDISIRNNPVDLHEPMTRGQWQKTWDCLSDTHSALSRAVEQFRVDVTNALPQKQIQNIPKGEDVLEFVRLHYSNMETMARQINVLSEVLMWKSPKVVGANMELGNPRY